MLNKNFMAPFYGVQLTQGYGCFRKKIIHDVQNIFVASKSCFFFPVKMIILKFKPLKKKVL